VAAGVPLDTKLQRHLSAKLLLLPCRQTPDCKASAAQGPGGTHFANYPSCCALQEFAWSEADLPAKREERRSGVCDVNGDSPMDTQPM
jgi:hypothetical protein